MIRTRKHSSGVRTARFRWALLDVRTGAGGGVVGVVGGGWVGPKVNKFEQVSGEG